MTPAPTQGPLSDTEMEELDAFMASETLPDEALDIIGTLGLLAAVAISPVVVPAEEWLEVIFDGAPTYQDDAQKARVESLLARELETLRLELDSGEPPELPCPLELDEDALLEIWAQGFMEGVFLRESQWFAKDETQVAQLLLPMMLASGLFEDPELEALRADPKLCKELLEAIPDNLVDLYLHFRINQDGSS